MGWQSQNCWDTTIRGRNHYPQDIEMTVEESHPAIRPGCGAAFSMETDHNQNEQLIIVQEIKESLLKICSSSEIITAIRQAITLHHQIHVTAIILLKKGSISKTSSGKIQRYACRDRYISQHLDIIDQWQLTDTIKDTSETTQMIEPGLYMSPSQSNTHHHINDWFINAISKKLCIKAEDVDISAPLASIGLDSLQISEIHADLYSHFDIDLPVESLLGNQPIRKLSQRISLLINNQPSFDIKEEEMINNLDQLSEDEIDALLAIT